MPELVFVEPPPPTELTGAGGFEVLEQPASHNETSDNAAMRRTVNLWLPGSFIPQENLVKTRDVITVQSIGLDTGKRDHDTLTNSRISRKTPGIQNLYLR